MARLTETGIEIERLDEVVSRLNNGFRAIYGQNINLNADTPDGQMVGLIAQMKMDFEELTELVYKQLDPDFATGAWLEQRVAYAGLVRRQSSYSYLRSAILTGEPQAVIPKGVIVSDGNKVRWLLVQEVTLNAEGSAQADFRSEALGAFNLSPNTTLTIETVTLGLNAVVSGEIVEMGEEEETDSQLRQRFWLARTQNAQNSAEAIEANILKLPDVKQVKVFENDTATRDKNGIAARTINVIVEGGDEMRIAKTIYDHKSAGVGLQGGQTVRFQSAGQTRTIHFDRATPVDIVVSMRLVRYEDFTEVDKNEIIRLLSELRFEIGKDVAISRLYSPINAVGGFWVKSLQIGKKGQPLANENIPLTIRELARILKSDIQIEVE